MYKLLTACVFLLMSSSAYTAEVSLRGLGDGVIATVVYSFIGIIMATIGFKVVDWLTPGNLAEEVSKNENRALAILAGSMILGVCIIIASAVVG